jgi:hypothetical protein
LPADLSPYYCVVWCDCVTCLDSARSLCHKTVHRSIHRQIDRRKKGLADPPPPLRYGIVV